MFVVRATLLLLAAICASGQQTIFDVPSADVAAKNDWFFQHQTTARAWNPGRYWVQTNAFGYGAGKHTELDATWFNLDAKLPGLSVASFGFKSSIPLGGEHTRLPSKLIVGDLVLLRGSSSRVGDWAYLMMNTELPRTHSRLTAGISAGTSALFGRQATSFMSGIEQPLRKRWMLQADWFSGRHDLGYAIPGIVRKFRSRWMVSLGYQLPNRHSHGVRAVVVELTRS